MPWIEKDAMDQRIEFVILAAQRSSNLSELCRKFNITRRTGYKWLVRYHEMDSVLGLLEQSRRPLNSPFRTKEKYESRALELRDKHGWGGKKLRKLLKDEGIYLSVSTINRIIRRNGRLNPKRCHKPALKRFERERPNQLWQMDFKGEWSITEGKCYPLSIVDDHSRFAVCLHALTNKKIDAVCRSVTRTFRRYGIPDAMLMDHGVPWWSNTNGHGLTRFSVFLIKQDIKLLYAGIRHPQTNGKVERFNGTLLNSLLHRGRPRSLDDCRTAFGTFLDEYNFIRPHEALDMKVPSDRYKRSSRDYNPNPREWEYPEGVRVFKLNTQGQLFYRSKYYFVCEALAGERVMLQEYDDKALVTFRRMHVREINFLTGITTAVVIPVAPDPPARPT